MILRWAKMERRNIFSGSPSRSTEFLGVVTVAFLRSPWSIFFCGRGRLVWRGVGDTAREITLDTQLPLPMSREDWKIGKARQETDINNTTDKGQRVQAELTKQLHQKMLSMTHRHEDWMDSVTRVERLAVGKEVELDIHYQKKRVESTGEAWNKHIQASGGSGTG